MSLDLELCKIVRWLLSKWRHHVLVNLFGCLCIGRGVILQIFGYQILQMWSIVDGSWKLLRLTETTSICFQMQTFGWSSLYLLPRNPHFPVLSVQKSSRTVKALFHKLSLCDWFGANGCGQLLTAPLDSRTKFKGSLDWSSKTSWDPQCEGW